MDGKVFIKVEHELMLSWFIWSSYWLYMWLLLDESISVLKYLDSIKDLGVTFDAIFKFDHHINEKVNESYSVLGLVYRSFKYMWSDTFFMLYKTLVRSHLGYANCVWSPYRQMEIEKIESTDEQPKWFNNWRNILMKPDWDDWICLLWNTEDWEGIWFRCLT